MSLSTDHIVDGSSPSKSKEDGQERHKLQLLLAKVHRHNDQLQEVNQEQRGRVRDEALVDSDFL